jgi:hypothetical protein
MMITERDVDWVAEIEAQDGEALEEWEAARDDERCGPHCCTHIHPERWGLS